MEGGSPERESSAALHGFSKAHGTVTTAVVNKSSRISPGRGKSCAWQRRCGEGTFSIDTQQLKNGIQIVFQSLNQVDFYLKSQILIKSGPLPVHHLRERPLMTSHFGVGRQVRQLRTKQGNIRQVGWPGWDVRFFQHWRKVKSQKILKNYQQILKKA